VLLASTADIIGVHIAMDIMATAATHIATTAAITVIATTATITIIGATIITIIAIGKTCRAIGDRHRMDQHRRVEGPPVTKTSETELI